MSNTYYVIKDNLLEALNHIEKFEEGMIKFSQKHPQYIYSVNLKKLDNDKWEVEIQIRTKDENTTETS